MLLRLSRVSSWGRQRGKKGSLEGDIRVRGRKGWRRKEEEISDEGEMGIRRKGEREKVLRREKMGKNKVLWEKQGKIDV